MDCTCNLRSDDKCVIRDLKVPDRGKIFCGKQNIPYISEEKLKIGIDWLKKIIGDIEKNSFINENIKRFWTCLNKMYIHTLRQKRHSYIYDGKISFFSYTEL